MQRLALLLDVLVALQGVVGLVAPALFVVRAWAPGSLPIGAFIIYATTSARASAGPIPAPPSAR